MSVIIAGSRDLEITIEELDLIITESQFEIKKLINGLCPTGIDAVALKWANKNNIPIETYKAEWEKYGKSAGPKRNKLMASKAEKLIAIYKKNALTPGTRNMIEEAQVKKLIVFIKVHECFHAPSY